MYRGFSFRLIPTPEQEQYFWQASGAARYIYNWALDEYTRQYNEGEPHLSGFEMCRELTKLKKQPDHAWLNTIHSRVTKQAILDCSEAFNRFFTGQNRYPRHKTKRNNQPSFSIDTDIQDLGAILTQDGQFIDKRKNKIKFYDNNTVKLSGLPEPVKLTKHAKTQNLPFLTKNYIKLHNCRVKHDGRYWCLTFSLDIPTPKPQQTTDEILGIDLGVKSTAILSDKTTYKNINKTRYIKKQERRKRKLQQHLSRKYEANKTQDPVTHKPKYHKTNNIKKLENKIRKIDRKLANTRKTYNHTISLEIVSKKPRAIVMEDLNIQGMLKNRRLSKAIQQQNLYQLKTFIRYKAESQGIQFIEAPRNYKSTQLCSSCGAQHKVSLGERTYRCRACGTTLNRDLNASYNLRNYGSSLLLTQP